MKPDMEKIIEVLISLLEEQEKVEITYTIEKTAQAVGEVDKHEKKRTKNKMAENHQRNGVRDPDRRRNRTCI